MEGRRGGAAKKLYTPRSIYTLFAVCWFSYFCTYLGRLNFTACIAEIETAGALSKVQLGRISSAFFVCYGLGQFFSGFLADRLRAKALVGLGLLGSAAINFGMAISRTPGWMAALWAANGLCQALAWAPLVRTVANLARGEQCARICLNLATTTPAGTLAAYLMCVVCVALGSWRSAFLAGGVFLAAAGAVWLAGITGLERLAARDGLEDATPLRAGGASAAGAPPRLPLMLLPLCLAACLHGLLKDGIMTWVPSLLKEQFGFPAAFSIALTMLLPVVNLSGVYLADRANVRRFHNEAAAAGFFFLLCGAGMCAWALAGRGSFPFTFAMLLFSTTCMTGVSTLLLSLFPLRFRRWGAAATVTGVLNAVTYAGSALSSVGFGALSARWGWGVVGLAWCAAALLGAGVCAAGRGSGRVGSAP